MMHRRHLLTLAATLGCAPAVWAQPSFPHKPLKIVVPNAAGGAADITARTIGQKLSEALGQPVVIDNKPSAGGIVAADLVAKAEPDGHTMLLISSGTAVSASLFKSLPFDTIKDFSPVSKLASFDLVLCVAEGGRFKTLGDVLSYARANPGKLNYSLKIIDHENELTIAFNDRNRKLDLNQNLLSALHKIPSLEIRLT